MRPGTCSTRSSQVEVDLIERLPTPWGLVRLGVAPDHPNIKTVSRAFEQIAAQAGLPLLRQRRGRPGHLARGSGVASTTPSSTRSARRPTGGSGSPARICPGSWAAIEFVAWYNGHPDFQELEFDLAGERAVVVGNGNVALDVARMLALTRGGARSDRHHRPGDRGDRRLRSREILVLGPPRPGAGGLDAGGAGASSASSRAPTSSSIPPTSSSTRRARPSRGGTATRSGTSTSCADFAAREPTGKPRLIRLRFLASPVAISATSASRRSRSFATGSRRDDGRVARRADGRARAGPLRPRLPQRRLPRRRRCPACPSTRRRGTIRNDCGRVLDEAGRARRRASTARAGSSAARPGHRHEQEGRDGDRGAAARGRARRPALRDGRRPPKRSTRCSTSAASAASLLGLGGDRRARALARRAARPPAREARRLGRAARRRRGRRRRDVEPDSPFP